MAEPPTPAQSPRAAEPAGHETASPLRPVCGGAASPTVARAATRGMRGVWVAAVALGLIVVLQQLARGLGWILTGAPR